MIEHFQQDYWFWWKLILTENGWRFICRYLPTNDIVAQTVWREAYWKSEYG